MANVAKAVLLGGARTPMSEWVGGKTGAGKPGGRLKDVTANELGAVAIRGALARAAVDPQLVDHVVMGNALQTSGDAIYGARHAALRAGLPIEVPALTVNRLCGSGIQAVITASQMVQLGEARIAVAGGMESLSQAPHVIRGTRTGFKLGQGQLEDLLLVALKDSYCGLLMAQTAEKLARQHDIPRSEQDAYAFRSMAAARAALDRGVFAAEIVPVAVKSGRGQDEVSEDDHLFQNPSLEIMAQLPPAFGPEGMVTAGNASGLVDGAAALIVAAPEFARELGKPVLAEVVFTGAKNARSFMCGALSEKGDAGTELRFAADLLARVTVGLPRTRLALHICRGNWTRDERAALAGDYRPLLPLLAEAPVGTLFLELATPRAGELDVLGDLPRTLRVGVGVVNQKHEGIEGVDEIVARARRAVAVFGADRV